MLKVFRTEWNNNGMSRVTYTAYVDGEEINTNTYEGMVEELSDLGYESDDWEIYTEPETLETGISVAVTDYAPNTHRIVKQVAYYGVEIKQHTRDQLVVYTGEELVHIYKVRDRRILINGNKS